MSEASLMEPQKTRKTQKRAEGIPSVGSVLAGGGDREGWEKMTLRKAGVSLIDCDHRTPPASDGGYPYIAIPQLKAGRIDLSDVRRITHEHFIEWTRKAKPQHHDVILSRRCNPGETAHVPAGLDCALGQNLVLLRADGVKVYPPFLRWLVCGQEWWNQIGKFLNVGAIFDSLKCGDVPNFELTIPPLPTQRRIASILGALDDKIEANRRMNATLEAMARAVFKAWFVDSVTDRLPAGWREGRIADIATNPRRTIQPDEIKPNTPYIALDHMPRRCIALGEWDESADVASGKSVFRKGEILFGKLRPYFHKVGVAPVDGVCSTDILVLAPQSPEWFGFLLGHASSDELVKSTDQASTGTKMPRTNWETIGAFKVALPPKEIAAEFNRLVEPMVAQITVNLHQARALSALRDSLLPRLLNKEFFPPSMNP